MARWDACHSTAVQKDGDTSSKDHVDRDNDEDGESDEMKSNARKADKSWSRFYEAKVMRSNTKSRAMRGRTNTPRPIPLNRWVHR